MLNWLSQNPDALVALLTLVGGWFGLTKKKADTSKLKEQLLTKLRAELHRLIDEHATLETARKHLDTAATLLLGELGVERTKTLDLIIAPLIEQALKEFSERVGAKLLQSRLEELFDKLSGLPGAFDIEEPTVPLEDATNVEVVPRDGTEEWSKPFGELGVQVHVGTTTAPSPEVAAAIVREKLAAKRPPEDK